MNKALIIGGGFAGCSAAYFLEKKGWHSTLVEIESFLGGGCKTHFYGGHPYTIGPRHFLTKDESLFDFLNQFTPMRRIPDHEFLTYVERDPGFYHFPIHRDDIPSMPDREKIWSELDARGQVMPSHNLEEFWINSVGPTLYDKFVKSYTKKMWQLETNAEFDAGEWSAKAVPLKSGPKAAWTEAISAFPVKINGYDDYFDVATRDADVHLNTRIEAFDAENHRVKIQGEWHVFDAIISTISPELLLNDAFGPLRWMGRELWKIVLPVQEVFPPNVYFLYYANDEPFTRMVEYKKFYRYDAPSTLIGLEIPSLTNKLYPYPLKKEMLRAQQYLDALPERVFSIGRAGSYDYLIGIADAIRQGREVAESL
jgi:UDP-galactopyranose mutase